MEKIKMDCKRHKDIKHFKMHKPWYRCFEIWGACVEFKGPFPAVIDVFQSLK